MSFPMNLQIFAESVETPEPAEPVSEELGAEVVDTPEETEGEEVQEPAAPAVDENAIYAAARRSAERDMNGLNGRVLSRFGNMKNPETGKPIRTANDYFDALEAQERVNARQQMQEHGVNPELLAQLIANDPTIRQAKEVLRENNLLEGEREIDEQVRKISEIDPNLKSLDDIYKMDTFQTFDNYVRNHGLSLVEAFYLANKDSLSQKDVAATKQAAINAAKGKSHMTPVGGGAPSADTEVDIPVEERSIWEAAYPDLSYKELKAKYNKSL